MLYFALFAILYGLRLWIQSNLLHMGFPDSGSYLRLASGIDFIIPVPAVLFFDYAGLLDRASRVTGYLLVIVGTCPAIATIVVGPLRGFQTVNNLVVIIVLLVLAAQFFTDVSRSSDLMAVRRGLLIFIAFALWDNVAGMLRWEMPRVEPIGFAAFLTALGFVAARKSLRRDQELVEIHKELEVAKQIQLSILTSSRRNPRGNRRE